MSRLAEDLDTVEFVEKSRFGPMCAGWTLYKDCDQEDLEAVRELKNQGKTWEQIQLGIDELLGIEEHLPKRQFARHWRAECSCWRSNNG